MTWRIGIAGAGMIARVHAAAVEQTDNARITGVMDNGRGTGEQIAPGTRTDGADNMERFVNRDDIDVVMIATPSGTHGDIVALAAAAGKHVLCEKPLEISTERIDQMIACCDSAGVTLGGIFNTRYTEGARIVKAAIQQGRLGRICFGSAFCPWWRDQDYYDSSDWKGTWALDGGGALMNQGIHTIDLLQWFMDSPATRVSGHIATLAHERVEVEDTGSASVEFLSGALGAIACTTSMWPGHFRTITVGGTDGTIALADGNLIQYHLRDEQPEDEAIRNRLGGLPGAGVGAADPAAGVDADGHAAVLTEFLDALDSGSQPAVDGHESRKSVAIIEAIYQSARAGGDAVVLTP